MNSRKRATIYDVAKELGISPSYVSKALNNHPSVGDLIRRRVKEKADQLNYKHNSHAANLRRGQSRTIGVVVPHINQSFFSDAISGIEEVCFARNHSLVICQSHESYEKEGKAIETLIHQNVDCILISNAEETISAHHLRQANKNKIPVIQFDRCLDDFDSFKVVNDNKAVSYEAVRSLIREGYRNIAFLGGPSRVKTFQERKEGFIAAIDEANLPIPYNFIVENALSRERGRQAAMPLLKLPNRPDAIFSVSDYQSLGVMDAAAVLGISIPSDLGLFGFADETFAQLVTPSLSTIDQHSVELGRKAAELYFQHIYQQEQMPETETIVIASEMRIRQSSRRQ
ncbi:MAG: LacI family DNA-binding transcriptional regulator [Bacteroidota bacterium]|nr:LacI family DNA-binding transcriptional regulator [Bacteroidota bacterium]MDP4216693.1 LacI family DNA-binding transcriptional regulator [Bacteroidota bacterium]MDP4247548.1 LacI family DNA-binding transcriptional regulator [Bacteroidota bacterium]MDP4257238.1 LacI family DNA-binding transcriptional regulator [Bacteroidota bacterium]